MELNDILQEALGQGTRQGNELLFKCPFCKHHKRKLSINTQTRKWHCWVCDAKGTTLFNLLYRLGKKSGIVAYRNTFSNKQADELATFKLALPPEYVPLAEQGVSFAFQSAKKYLRKRHVTDQQILQHKIGFALTGKYSQRIILPSFDINGALNFFTGRTISDASLRYLNPKTPAGYKNTIIFNELNIDWTRPAVILEGFFDMLKVQNGIPLFGSTINEDSKLFAYLATASSPVYVCLDPDARRKQFRLIKLLLAYGVEVYNVNIGEYKDVGDMPESAIAQALLDAKPMTQLELLKARMRS